MLMLMLPCLAVRIRTGVERSVRLHIADCPRAPMREASKRESLPHIQNFCAVLSIPEYRVARGIRGCTICRCKGLYSAFVRPGSVRKQRGTAKYMVHVPLGEYPRRSVVYPRGSGVPDDMVPGNDVC